MAETYMALGECSRRVVLGEAGDEVRATGDRLGDWELPGEGSTWVLRLSHNAAAGDGRAATGGLDASCSPIPRNVDGRPSE